MTTMASEAPLRMGRVAGRASDRTFRLIALAAGLLVLVVLALIAVSMTGRAIPAFAHEGIGFLTSSTWNPTRNQFGALAFIYGTLLVSVIALVIGVPLSIGIALFITEIAPRRLRRPAAAFMDVLAAVPSVVFGLWGVLVLAPALNGPYATLASAVKGVPVLGTIFSTPATGKSFLTAGLIVALMITPIITSITREVFDTVPDEQRAGALALGMTRWEMIRAAIFPHSRAGIVGAVMLGLGRAMGETIAVALVVGAALAITPNVLSSGDTMAATIANNFGETTGGSLWQSALIGLAVVLFAMTILVNLVAQYIVNRGLRRVGGTA